MPLLVTRLGHYVIVLGIPWLRRHDPSIKFSANSLAFDSSFCTEHCLSTSCTAVQGLPEIAALPKVPTTTILPNPSPPPPLLPPPLPNLSSKPDIHMTGAGAFQFLAKRPRVEIFTLSINAINHDVKKHPENDIQIALNGKTPVDLFSKLPPDYHSYADVFSVSESDKLPPHRTCDHAINRRITCVGSPPTDMKYYEQPSNFLKNNKLSGAPEFVPINNIGPSSPKLP